jgi:diaminohydroxyphosphoribosylaminopyrimidine deaminase / 5-amino-6-(5-phosphoribosylamino)uracil reductase
MTTDDDLRFMAAAIRLARRNEGLTATNPSVACLIVRDDGDGSRIVGSGVTAIGGRPHAEPIALAEAGELARGATAYATLEPCAHHGRTPPCAQTLIDAGVARVVIAATDPDQRVNGKGRAMIEAAGIKLEDGVLAKEAGRGLAAYLAHKQFGRPQVMLKLAVSADGFVGRRGAGQVAITGTVARAQMHLMRARHQAILVGVGTVLEDNPELTCRLHGLERRSPARIVLDPNGRMPTTARIAQTARQVPTLVVAPPGFPNQVALAEQGCEFLACEQNDGRVALPELLEDLGARGIMSLMVEGGAAVAQSFLSEGLADEIALFVGAGELAGGGVPVASPVAVDGIPPGFRRSCEWHFGDDVLRTFERDD